MCAPAYTHNYVCMYVSTYIHTYIYMYVHAYVNAYIVLVLCNASPLLYDIVALAKVIVSSYISK